MHIAAQPTDCRHALVPERSGRERRVQVVVAITAAMMIAELVVGYATRSMALTADGWHMATHAGALGLAAAAYWFARTRALDHRFSFGTGKVHALAGYTSALILMLIALSMLAESITRLVRPVDIEFREALPIAVVGLVVNLISAKILDHDEDDAVGGPAGAVHDHNHAAAFKHVAADAFTSVLAVVAIVLGWRLGWRRLDSFSGIAGGAVILKWGYDLCRTAGRQLVDATSSRELESKVRSRLESVDDVLVTDLHSWELGQGRRGCIVALTTSNPRQPTYYRDVLLSEIDVAHLTVQVDHCVEGHR